MPEPPNGGLGLPGAMRLERIEQQGTRTAELVGALGNKVELILERQSQIRDRLTQHDRHHEDWERGHSEHVVAHEKRHRGLDFRWYGIIAGVAAAAGYIIYQGGPPA